jgi:hypothetical protein
MALEGKWAKIVAPQRSPVPAVYRSTLASDLSQQFLVHPQAYKRDEKCRSKGNRSSIKHRRPICFEALALSSVRFEEIASDWGSLAVCELQITHEPKSRFTHH